MSLINMLSLHLTLLSMLLSTTSGYHWVLRMNVDGIVPGATTDLQMVCKQEQTATGNQVKNAVRIRITKMDKSGQSSSLAEITVTNNVNLISMNANLKATGQIVQGGLAFLQLRWSKVTHDDLGTYGCDVDGFDQQYAFVSQNVATLVMEERKTITTTATTTSTTTTQNPTKSTGSSVKWPGGNYGLVETSSGCPNPQPDMTVSIEKSPIVKTELGALRFGLFVDGNSRAPINYCVMDVKSSGGFWPQGSYCISYPTDGNPCPMGFEYGTTVYRHKLALRCYGYAGFPIERHIEKFCCRSDGPSSLPISLPSAKPFYLYKSNKRTNGCQKVAGMSVREHLVVAKTDRCNDIVGSNTAHGSRMLLFQTVLCYYESARN